MATREDQIAAANARYTELKNEIRKLQSVIKTKDANKEDIQEEKEKMEELVISLKKTVDLLNQLRKPAGSSSKQDDKGPIDFILDMVSSSFEGLISTSLGPLELLIQLVDFFVRLFVSFVQDIFNKVKRFIDLILNQVKAVFPQIEKLFDGLGIIELTSKTVQNLWYNIVDLVKRALGDLQNIFYSFSEFFSNIIEEIINKVKNLLEKIITEVTNIFPQIDKLFNATASIEQVNKINQSIWYYMVDVISTIIGSIATIFSGVLSIFIGKVAMLDQSIGFFNNQVNMLLGLANLNNEIVNGTKRAFNDTITKVKSDLSSLKSKIDGLSGKSIKLGPFGDIKGPEFDLSPLSDAINSLKTIP